MNYTDNEIPNIKQDGAFSIDIPEDNKVIKYIVKDSKITVLQIITNNQIVLNINFNSNSNLHGKCVMFDKEYEFNNGNLQLK